MADAIAALKEAFSSYTRNLADFIIYSVITSVVGGILTLLLLAALISLGVLSAGSFLGFFASGTGLSIGAAGIALTEVVVAIGLLVFVWLQGGLTAAYIETLGAFLSGRKQTLAGFFSAIPRKATPMLILSIICGILVCLPIAAGLAVMLFVGGMAGTAALILGVFTGLVVSLFLIFAVPAVAVDGRNPADAVRISLLAVVRNLPGVVIYLVAFGVLALPAIVIAPLYVPLFYMPFAQAALVAFYRKAR